jgi:hypothetical protein
MMRPARAGVHLTGWLDESITPRRAPESGEPVESAEGACPEPVEPVKGPIPPLTDDQRRERDMLKEALHSEVRVSILLSLASANSANVEALAGRLGLAIGKVSGHLKLLRLAGFVIGRSGIAAEHEAC